MSRAPSSRRPSSEDVVTAYDRWASSYDVDPNRTRDLAGEVLRDAGLRLDGSEVVEIGCGTGGNTGWLLERARSVLALDVSMGMLRRARTRIASPRARFARHDVRTPWPLPDGSVDGVVAMLLLEHVEHLEPVFREAFRVLRRGGEIFVCELHPVRQHQGKQASFRDPIRGEEVRVAAFLHEVSEYVGTGLAVGFELLHLGEWSDGDAPRNAPPRLVSVRFRR